MTEEERREALENIGLIKELVLQTKLHVGNYGGGWISIIWGVFCFIGVGGQRLFIPHGPILGVWWLALAAVGIFATYLVSRSHLKTQPLRTKHRYMHSFFQFWIPLILLAYTLAIFIALTPELSNHYISTAVLLVISTGYLIIGLMFFKGILYMGSIGFIGSIITAIFFLRHSDIILGSLFGVGLVATGIVINSKWKTT